MDIFFILQPVSCLRKQQVDKLQGKYNVEPFYYIYLKKMREASHLTDKLYFASVCRICENNKLEH